MKIGTVTSEGLNVRVNPHKDAEKITALSKGDKVVVLDHKHFGEYTWLKVELADKTVGWVYGVHVDVKSAIPDEEPPHIPLPPELETDVWFYAKLVGIAFALCALAIVLTKCG